MLKRMYHPSSSSYRWAAEEVFPDILFYPEFILIEVFASLPNLCINNSFILTLMTFVQNIFE